jgi:hypothetical protein
LECGWIVRHLYHIVRLNRVVKTQQDSGDPLIGKFKERQRLLVEAIRVLKDVELEV